MKLYVPTFYLLKSFFRKSISFKIFSSETFLSKVLLPKINLLYFFVALIKKPIRQM